VTAFSITPSSLYGLFERREHLSSLTITFACAVYTVGVVVSLVLLPAISVAAVAAVLFLLWRSLPGT
jgi:MFS superfamily sulfate permease-like transporter